MATISVFLFPKYLLPNFCFHNVTRMCNTVYGLLLLPYMCHFSQNVTYIFNSYNVTSCNKTVLQHDVTFKEMLQQDVTFEMLQYSVI